MDMSLKKSDRKLDGILNNRNFMFLFSGKLISLLGDQIYIFALSWYILSITHSSLKMSALIIAGILPYVIVGPFAGIIADKAERKGIIVALDLVRGVLVVLMAILLIKNMLTMPLLYLGTVILGLCGSVFSPAASAIIPNIVEKEKLTQATSIDSLISGVCNIAGMLTGGILFNLIGITSIFIINAASYILSAILECNIRIPKSLAAAEGSINKQENQMRSVLSELGAGYSYLKRNKGLFILFIFFGAINFIIYPIGMIFIPYIFNVILKSTAIQLSIAQGTIWIGFIAGSFIVPNLSFKGKLRNILIRSISTAGIVILLLSIPLFPILIGHIPVWAVVVFYSILSVVLGLSITFINIPVNVTFQKAIPDDIRGRVMALLSSVTSATVPIGYVFGGVLAQAVPMYVLFIVMSFIMMMIVFQIKVSKPLRALN
ncbi:MAG TPA: MFS transporter [Clostridia bacterium]|nr:MFS transporter [Clostridia bacterium]